MRVLGQARLAEIDLFGESGMREAIVLRYKEKRRNRLFSNSKKIRYQVRKLNADQRPRMKVKYIYVIVLKWLYVYQNDTNVNNFEITAN